MHYVSKARVHKNIFFTAHYTQSNFKKKQSNMQFMQILLFGDDVKTTLWTGDDRKITLSNYV